MRSLNKLLSATGLTFLIAFLPAINPVKGQSPKIFVIDKLITDAIDITDNVSASDKILNLPDSGDPLVIIADELKTGTYSEVHLFLLTKPGSMIFDELNILADNVYEFTSSFGEWKKYLAPEAKIIIHSGVLTSEPDGVILVERLEELTGATVLVQN